MPIAKSPCVLFVSSFPPRACGIATFTEDLTNAVEREFSPAVKTRVLAMNADGTSLYNYSKKVALQISDSDMDDYLKRANEINNNPDIKLVNIQHEYGLFGGNWGNYVLPFMEMIKKPVVVTFHTILPRPDKQLKKITQDIIDRAAGVVVMTHHTARVLRTSYGIDKKKPIAVIPHGVHHVPFPSKSKAKAKLNLSGHTILSSFGHLSRDKGIEYAIEALPGIVAKHPDALYLVLGATHPNVVKHEGEVYRNKLIRLVKKLKLEDHVKFYNRYLDLDELIDFLKATDIYISPTINPKQAVSGTVSYALSCACPIVVTASQFAKDVITPSRGRLVDFENGASIEKAVLEILDDPKLAKEMKKDAYYYSRHMTWQNVALAYFTFFNNFAPVKPRDTDKLPPINLNHIKKMTDDFGMIQFAVHTKPDPHSGYCLDDNARALIGFVRLNERHPSKGALRMIQTYFDYLKHSQKPDGMFMDFINRPGIVTADSDSESHDSFGRAVWCLGETLGAQKLPPEIIKQALVIFNKTLPHIKELNFSRSLAFVIIGLTAAIKYFERQDDQKRQTELTTLVRSLSETLVNRFEEQSKESGWKWFDDHLAYSNYKIPESLFMAYELTRDKRFLKIAVAAVDFLNQVTLEKGYYNAIGQDGWYFRNGKRAYFDQQPEDAATAVEALVVARKITGKEKYAVAARDAFNWFLGKNHLNQMIYDEATGGCYDGLGKHSINFNQGAESTLSYFLARLAVEDVFHSKKI